MPNISYQDISLIKHEIDYIRSQIMAILHLLESMEAKVLDLAATPPTEGD